MALSFSTKALITLGAVATAGLWVRAREAKKERRQRRARVPAVSSAEPTREASCLFKAQGPGGQIVRDSDRIWNDLHSSLQTDEIANTVVDLDPSYAEVAYEHMGHLIIAQNLDLGEAEQRDRAIKETLKLIAGACDWSEGLAPYTYDSPQQKAWTGVGELGRLAQSNIEAFALHGDEEEEGEGPG